MASNTDEKSKAFLARLIRLEEERRNNAEDRKELGAEMKSAELLKEEIAGIKLAVKRHFEEPEKRAFRESAEDFAAALGGFADTPLGTSAIRHVRNDPGVRRAMKRGNKAVAEGREILGKMMEEGTPLEDAIAATLEDAGIPFERNVSV
jgi:uncharacterized protein (UPF0335 family)